MIHGSSLFSKQRDVPRRRRSGMSIVEIMIAMVVLSFGLLGVAAIQVRAITEGSGGQNLSTASSEARNRLEELGRLPWAHLDLAHDAGAWSAATTQTDNSGQAYAIQDRITWDNTNVLAVQLKEIEVRATWDDAKRQNRQVVLTSTRLREVNE